MALTGREIKAGFAKASVWRTAVDIGPALNKNGLWLTSEGLGAKEPKFVDDMSMGMPDILYTYRVSEALPGRTLEGYLRFANWEVMLACALGTAGIPTETEAGVAYLHLVKPATNIDDLFGTFVMKKSDTAKGIWEIPTAKISGFTITAEIGELVTITFNLDGNKIETEAPHNDGTGDADVEAADVWTSELVCRMDQLFKIRMNPTSDIALADGDKIYPNRFTLVYTRPMDEDYTASEFTMAEPAQDGFAESTLELGFDRYNQDTFMTAIENETDYKMDILFQGLDIPGTASSNKYHFRVDMPRVKWKSGDAPADGPGKIPHTITGAVMAIPAAPTGMTDLTQPLQIEFQNEMDTDPLA